MQMSLLFTLYVGIATLASAGIPQTTSSQTTATKPQIVTAAQVNGVYRFYKSEFRILALGQNKLKVQFDGVYVNLAKSVNVGYAGGEATIEGNVATFVPPDTERCKITMKFLPGKIVVTQEGDDFECGFGHNVNAAGTYKKIRSGKPRFESLP
jgi:hypothetical protein